MLFVLALAANEFLLECRACERGQSFDSLSWGCAADNIDEIVLALLVHSVDAVDCSLPNLCQTSVFRKASRLNEDMRGDVKGGYGNGFHNATSV